ncbi:hypothetical protein EJB05_37276, partial [Eragrostis curvula]
MEPTVHDVLTFHRPDRAAYEHLVSLGAGRQPARDAVALLMWLHRRCCAGRDAVTRVPAIVCTRADAARLVYEARTVLAGVPLPEMMSSPALVARLSGPDAARVRGLLALTPADALRRGVEEVVAGIGTLVFEDRLHELMWLYEEGGSGGVLPPALAAPYRGCSRAASGAAPPPEEDDGRSLFLTFSKGLIPLTHDEIEDYFAQYVALGLKARYFQELIPTFNLTSYSRRWGNCVEKVMIEKTPLGEPPSYGRIVLSSASAVAVILGGQSLVKLVVNGRQVWARKYVPRQPM